MSKSKNTGKAESMVWAACDGKDLKESDLKRFGGKKVELGKRGGEVYSFGWIPPDNRTREQEAAVGAAVASMPRFAVSGASRGDDKKVVLWPIWKHEQVKEAVGFEWTGTHQFTGSCVWAGAQNVMCTLHWTDVLIKGEAEGMYVPFGLLAYGRSRFYLGDRNRGEGSTGSTYAKAARDDGFLDAKQSGLPAFKSGDGVEWGGAVELSWSDGDAPQTMELLATSRQRLVKTTAQCRDHNDVREAVKNGYPVTVASMYGHNGGRVQGTGGDACLLASRSGSWSHQMSILGWWEHPQFGEIFWLMNQWGQRAHGICPTGAPPGGVWIKASDVDWICRDEAFAFSGYDGFPSRDPLVWIAA